MNNPQQLVAACTAMVVLVSAVGARMLVVRIGEIRASRLTLQAASTSLVMATRFRAVQPADNFRNLFEVAVSFGLLVGLWFAFTAGFWAKNAA